MTGRKTTRAIGTRKGQPKNAARLGESRGKPIRSEKEAETVKEVRRYVMDRVRDINAHETGMRRHTQ